MNLSKIVEHLAESNHSNVVVCFENAQVVRRTHSQVYLDVRIACAHLNQWGVKPGMRVGIRAANCYQWLVYDLALIETRAISVAFTDDFASADFQELIDKYSLSLLLVSSADTKANSRNSTVAFLDAENGDVQAIPNAPVFPDYDFENPGLVFSSGSSGRLKGLILNRLGIEASVDAFTQAVGPQHDDCLLLFLPISNFQQRLMYYSAFWYGFDLIVTDPTHLFRALKDIHPTILIAPPMLYEAFETRFSNLPLSKQRTAKIAGNIIRWLPRKTWRNNASKLFFKEVHKALGGRMRCMITGMAPIRRSTLTLFGLMQLPLFETYGITEFGSISLNLPGACKPGSVGRLLPGVKVEFADDGEIIARREHSLASGYFECSAAEESNTFIARGRVATGDIGRIDDEGYLHLLGRKKEIVITSGGEKIHPEIIEAEIESCPEVERAVVFKDADEFSLAAVVLPRRQNDLAVRERIEQAIEGINDRMPSMQVSRVVFTDIVFSRENGFLRPNLKLDRKRIARHFQPQAGPELVPATRSA